MEEKSRSRRRLKGREERIFVNAYEVLINICCVQQRGRKQTTTTIAANQSSLGGDRAKEEKRRRRWKWGVVVFSGVLQGNMEIISNSDNYCMVKYCI